MHKLVQKVTLCCEEFSLAELAIFWLDQTWVKSGPRATSGIRQFEVLFFSFSLDLFFSFSLDLFFSFSLDMHQNIRRSVSNSGKFVEN